MSGTRVGRDPSRPTRVRWRIFALLLGLIAVNYLDRATLSVAMPTLSRAFGIDPDRRGLLLSAFFWAYALSQIPAGALVDRVLPRRMLTAATVLWGGFAALAAAATGFVFLFLTRLGLGVAESPVYLAGAKLAGSWLTRAERGRGAALLDGGAPLGAAFGAIAVGLLMSETGSWRIAFLVAGVGTMACGALAWTLIRDDPRAHPAANEAERAYLASAIAVEREAMASDAPRPTILSFFRQGQNWLLFAGWFCFNGQWYGFLTWIPSYLDHAKGLNIASLGALSSLIFASGFLGDLAGGSLLDALIARTGRIARAYRIVYGTSSALATAAVFAVPYAHGFPAAVGLLVLSQFFLRWCGTFWSLPSLLTTPDRAGFLAGAMNLFGNLSGIVVPVVIGVIVDRTGSYRLALLFLALMGAVLFASTMAMRYRREQAG